MMKRTFFVLLALGFVLSFTACDNKDKEAETLLNQEIMKVHDEVMPKMGELNRMKRQIGAYKDAVSDDNAVMKDSLINAILLLSKTLSAMVLFWTKTETRCLSDWVMPLILLKR